jgi:DNA-binding transcriptional LysR family regulator
LTRPLSSPKRRSRRRRDIFDAQGLPCPRASVVATALEMTINLLRTDRYLAILPESVFNFPTKHPFIRKLPAELPIVSGPIGILTLKNRDPGPAMKLFVDCARGLAKPLAPRK